MKNKIILYVLLLSFSTFTANAQCDGGNPNTDFGTSYQSNISIEDNFNAARRWEESNRGLTPNCLGDLTPPQTGWSSLTDIERAFYILQQERIARQRLPFEGMESNLNAVAEAHSQWQIDNNKFSHTGNPAQGTSSTDPASGTACYGAFTGSNFIQRINSNSNIDNCYQTASENIGVIGGNQDVVTVIIYGMMYRDLACCSWGHRNNFLANYSNNFGESLSEGFIGIGIASSSNYVFPTSSSNCPVFNSKIITFNTYDPQGSSNCTFDPITLDNPGCTALLTLDGNIPDGTHLAMDIVSSGTVSSTSDVTFRAESSILLEGNFTVELGGVFSAEIGSCSSFTSDEPSLVSAREKEPLVMFGQPITYYGQIKTDEPTRRFEEAVTVVPNPFTDQTIISYTLEQNTEITIDIFDINGRKVANVLPTQEQVKGHHQTTFYAQDLAKGMYYIHLRTNHSILTKRMMLMK